MVTDCQTMALLMARSMGLEVTSVGEDGVIGIKLNLAEPFEYLDSALNG
jgi:hypothetical protein